MGPAGLLMYEGHDRAICDLLTEAGRVSRADLERCAQAQETAGHSFADQLLVEGLIDRDTLLTDVAAHTGCRVELNLPASLNGEALAAVPALVAHHYAVAPLAIRPGVVRVAAADPFDLELRSGLGFALERTVEVTVADPAAVWDLIRRHYGESARDHATLAEPAASRESMIAEETLTTADLQRLADKAPVVRMVEEVLSRAVAAGASDVHFEPFEDEFRIRHRVDGTLRELPSPSRALALPVISRLKVMANLDIAERRVPQDGRIRCELGGRAVDLRLSTLPTQFGESAVLRVLDQSAIRLGLGELGLPAAIQERVESTIRRPNGIFVVTGPTGAGKTTTLYACLQALNSREAKLLTIEDPVEYEIDGIMQVPVNPVAGLTFARALRSFLRQDPDVVMVGEIRDLETARIAIQASLTGHLVLTTLHTNDAPSAAARLLDLGVEPFLLASTLEGVLAQRLLKRLCPDCREPRALESSVAAEPGLRPDEAPRTFAACGCSKCGQTGYRGRIGIFEFLPVDEAVREGIAAGVSLEALRDLAHAGGMVPLRAAAVAAMHAGETTAAEVLRYT